MILCATAWTDYPLWRPWGENIAVGILLLQQVFQGVYCGNVFAVFLSRPSDKTNELQSSPAMYLLVPVSHV